MTTEQQRAEAEAILGERLEARSFVKGLFFGQYLNDQLPRYPLPSPDDRVAPLLDELRAFCASDIDAARIDRQARIPDSVVEGLGRLGVLGACLPKRCGGMELTQTEYCRLLEVLGGHCGSTALFVNAHHSIGPRALVLFGTQAQQDRWLPGLARGAWLSAFALTEPEAGSDAANVQTLAVPSSDGRGYLLNGEKRWITNGGLARVLTVMARSPGPQGGPPAQWPITAFLVTPDMPGFEVVEARMEKCGVRGTATSRLAFRDMFVPRDHVLGEPGKGLRIALTVLDYGRTTFGASCTGAARFCVEHAVRHARQRVQFQQPLGAFELVKQKLAWMHAATFAMEACTYQTAAMIDAGESDFMLETAMLKVYSTEALWTIINDTMQIYGGKAYFTDEPFERMMRDARINTIGEGANDVLRVFSALVGMRDVGLELERAALAAQQPLRQLVPLARLVADLAGRTLLPPVVGTRSPLLEEEAGQLARLIQLFGRRVVRLLGTYREAIVDRQYQAGRMADAATRLYVAAAVLNRLDATLHGGRVEAPETRLDWETGRYFLQATFREIRTALRALKENDDAATTHLADQLLGPLAS